MGHDKAKHGSTRTEIFIFGWEMCSSWRVLHGAANKVIAAPCITRQVEHISNLSETAMDSNFQTAKEDVTRSLSLTF